MPIVTIPFRHNLEVTLEKVIAACNESQLNELLLLVNRELDIIEKDKDFQEVQIVNQTQFSPF